MRLTLRTLLAYLDDTLPPDEAKQIGEKVAESETARELVEKIRKVTRRRGLSTPPAEGQGTPSDPNTVAEYLSDALPSEEIAQFEKTCLESDVHLAEVAACHQILTLLLSEPVRVPPTARQRMYQLVRGPESLPKRKPGATVPVGGVPPDQPLPTADDRDAAYLLGMTAYSKAESTRQRAGQVLLLAGLLAALGLAVWAAWPEGVPASAVPRTGDFATTTPPPVQPPPQPAPPADTGKKPDEGGAKQPAESLRPPGDTPPKSPTDTAKPPARELVPATEKPRTDRLPVGRLDNAADAVVLAQPAENRWVRVGKADPAVQSADRLVSLPGYKGRVLLDTGLEVELWGNLPEQLLAPLLESAVTFYPPADGFDADITLHDGRVYLSARKPAGAKVRLRCRDEVWDLTLPDEKTDVAVEVTHSLVRGLSADVEPSDLPQTSIGLAVLKGTAGLKVRYKDVPKIAAGEMVTWTSKGPGLQGPRKAVGGGPAGDSAYFSRFPVLPNEAVAKAVQQALFNLSNSLAQPDLIRVKFSEMLDDAAEPTLPTILRARLAVLGSAAIADLPALIDALIDTRRPFVRSAAVYGLASVVATTPDGVERFRTLVQQKCRLTDEQARQAVRLLRGPTDAERADPKVWDQLVDHLGSRNPPVSRELALWVLKIDIDPESRATPALYQFDTAAPDEAVDAGQKAWKRRVEELKRKSSEPK